MLLSCPAYYVTESHKGGKGRELGGSVLIRHPGIVLGLVVLQIDDVTVIVVHAL
jgi:hypothetical protein